MLDSTLPKTVVIRKMVIRSGTLEGVVEIAALPRLNQLLVDELGKVDVYLEFDSDDQRRNRIRGHVRANVNVYCQRCLESMPLDIGINIDAAAVISDEKAQQLPRNIEPVMLDEEELNVYELVEDEILLAMPIVTMHSESCGERQYFAGSNSSADKEMSASDGVKDAGDQAANSSSEENKVGLQEGKRRPFEGLANMFKEP